MIRGVDLLGCPIFTNLTRVSVIAEGIRGEVDEREQHDTNTRTQIWLYSLAQTTNSIELQEKDQKVESLAKDCQTRIEFQRVKDQSRIELQSKRSSIDRITRMEKIRIRSSLGYNRLEI
jgi:hypothetical protein